MAFMNQDHKKQIEPTIKAICKKYGVKGTLAVRHHSTLVLNVASGCIDFLTQHNERTVARLTEQDRMSDYTPAKCCDINEYHFKEQWQGKTLEFLTEVSEVMNKGNHNNSDSMTDYFDVGWYVDINIGRWDKPYIFKPVAVTVALCNPAALNCADLPSMTAPTCTIQEHTHTKTNEPLYIVVMAERTSREEYLRILDIAKNNGGYYSRAFGSIPAGFAFKEREKAELFVGMISGNPEAPEPEDPAPTTPAPSKPKLTLLKSNISEKLRTMAGKMQGNIDSCFAYRIANTQKRLAQAMGARCEGERLLRTQKVLLALADLHDAGNFTSSLARFITKAAVFEHMGSQKTQVSNGYHGYYICTGKPYHDDPETLALWSLLTEKTEE